MARGAYAEAVGSFSQALVAVEAAAGLDTPPVAYVLNELGIACKFAGRFDEAESYYLRAVELVAELDGPECDGMASLLHNLGGLAHSRRRYAEGVEMARRGLALRERLNGPADLGVAGDLAALAALLEGVGENVEAEMLYRRALAIFDTSEESHEGAMARSGLGSACQSLGRYDEAEQHYRAALEMLERHVGNDHPDVGHVLNNLATLRRRRGDDVEARALLARAHELLTRALGPTHPVTVEVAGNRHRVDSTPSPYV